MIYWTVPNRLVPWRAIWPGALGATLAIGVIDYAFPLYLTNISSIAKLGTTLIFIVIVLIWFYALAIIVLGGAVINAARFEIYDTGRTESVETIAASGSDALMVPALADAPYSPRAA